MAPPSALAPPAAARLPAPPAPAAPPASPAVPVVVAPPAVEAPTWAAAPTPVAARVAKAEGTLRPTTPAGVGPVTGCGRDDWSARATRMANTSAATSKTRMTATTACHDTWILARRRDIGVVTSPGAEVGRCRPRRPGPRSRSTSAVASSSGSSGTGSGGSGIQPHRPRSSGWRTREAPDSRSLPLSSTPSKARTRAVTGDGGEWRGIRTTLRTPRQRPRNPRRTCGRWDVRTGGCGQEPPSTRCSGPPGLSRVHHERRCPGVARTPPRRSH